MQRLLTFPTPRVLRDLTLVAGFFTAFLFIYLKVLDVQLAPYNIVAYEFAFTPARLQPMFDAWGPGGLEVARHSLAVDFRFMPAYAIFFAGLVLIVARSAASAALGPGPGRLQSLGLDVFFLPFGAGVFDFVENLALLYLLRVPEQPSAAALVLAGMCALIKFLLLALSLVYILGVPVYRLYRQRTVPPPAAAPPA